ncbi:MAG: hypothetical protein A2Z15_08430 [Chloroflexi bacterium RBG_16_50_11]|nr:MAG: hypothetical protein A2Z15_08430 [Chloroflexi bacterium RBG_16_50_11]
MKSGETTQEQGLLEKEVTDALVDGYLSCPVGLKLAKRLGLDTKAIGETVDDLGIRVSNCQLGCFKVEKALHDDLEGRGFSSELIGRVRSSLRDGRLPCKTAHDIGKNLKTNLKEVGDAATKMKIKISDCQLGCFS